MYVNVIAVFHCFQFGVTPPLMCFWCCCVMHACACVSDFTSSTLRCLAGEVNTMEKMTRSTRCLWNGARHGHRHMRNKNTNAQEKDRTHTHTKRQTSPSSKQKDYAHTPSEDDGVWSSSQHLSLSPSPLSAGWIGFDTAREVRLNDMLGERRRHMGRREEGRKKGKEGRDKKRPREKMNGRNIW